MPDFSYENNIKQQGFSLVCGVDEAGRGPLAGPVCAAAVILPANTDIPGLNDSKKLSDKIKYNYVFSYACPSILSVNKETAEIFKRHLKATGANFDLIFTRNQNGRKELFKCRKYSYINLNNSKVKNKRKVN